MNHYNISSNIISGGSTVKPRENRNIATANNFYSQKESGTGITFSN